MIIALFFTRGVSLEKWLETGLFDREKLSYEEHLKRNHIEAVYWLTYGYRDAKLAKQLREEKILHSSIKVVQMPRCFIGSIGIIVYSFIMPILQGKYLKRANILKTNQMDGSWSAVIAKWIYRKNLIIRTGYTLSIFANKLEETKTKILLSKIIEWFAYDNTTLAVVSSQKDKKYISYKYGYPNKDIVVIPNYVDTSLFRPKNFERYDDRIIFVGRLNKQKNLFNLISAISKNNLTLDIYGEGSLKKELQCYAMKKDAIVNFMGAVQNKDLPDILNHYKYYILPSFFEGMPKTLVEAMSCGLVVIGTNIDGIKEIIKHKENGVICRTNAYSISQAFKIVMHDKSLCQRLGDNAREFVLKNYSINSIIKQEHRLYKRLVSLNI